MSRFAALFCAFVLVVAGCASADTQGDSETAAALPSTQPIEEPASQQSATDEDQSGSLTQSTDEPLNEESPNEGSPDQTDSPDGEQSVPFPPPENVVEWDEQDGLILGTPPSIADLYDITPVDSFVVFDDGLRRVSMIDAFIKEGRTFGYVEWTNAAGTTQSRPSSASHELATCAADVLAVSMERFEAELIARGAVADDEGPTALQNLFDLYIDCGGTDELLTSFRDDLRLSPNPLSNVACIESTVTTEEHLRILMSTVDEIPTDDFFELVGPCFNWQAIGFELEAASLECLMPRSTDGLRALTNEDLSSFTAILETCLTAEELAQIPN